jgi:hypothetical protein
MKIWTLNLTALSCFLVLTGCEKKQEAAQPEKKPVAEVKKESEEETSLKEAMSKMPEEDQRAALAQKFCAVQNDSRLGSMGQPIKVMIEDQPVFLCCKHCEKSALAQPKETLESVAKLKKANAAQASK